MHQKARELELEWQSLQQTMHNLEFAGPHEKEDYLKAKGFCDGVEYCLKKFS